MTDLQLEKKIIKAVKSLPWKEIFALGINAQQAQKIRRGELVRFYKRTLDRLRKKFEKVS